MRESMWGIFIIILGAVGIIAINLFQSLTVTNDQTYFLMKETTKAAMGDAVDLSYYRSTGRVRIVESKFVENLTRRFAESAALNKEYNIVIHDVVEFPPKVSLSILTNAQDMKTEKYDVFQKIDAIYEAIYKREDLYDEKYIEYETPGTGGTEPEKIYENGKCPNSNVGIDECISKDLEFLRWEELIKFNYQICPEDQNNLQPIDRDAFYKECECGKWSDEKFETINSGKPKIKDNISTYEWIFKKDGPVNDIDERPIDKVIALKCVNDLKILVKDDLPKTTWGGIECPPEGVTILIDQKQDLYPRYIPKESVNRNLKWTIDNNNISLTEANTNNIFYPNKDNVIVRGITIGNTIVTAESTNGKKATCLVKVKAEPDFECPTAVPSVYPGFTFFARIEKGSYFPIGSTIKYSVFDAYYGTTENADTGLIRGLRSGNSFYIATVTIDGKEYKKSCPYVVGNPPPPTPVPTCPPYFMYIQTFENTKQAEVVNPLPHRVTGYSTSNSSYLSISSSGMMTALRRDTEDKYLKYRVNFEGTTPIECDVIIKGTIPPDEEEKIGECPKVGTVYAVWEQAKYTMGSICPFVAQLYTTQANRELMASYVEVPVKQCGKTGTIYSDCSGSWTTTIQRYPVNAIEMSANSYRGRFNPTYTYINWQQTTCSGVVNNAEQPLGARDITKTYTNDVAFCEHEMEFYEGASINNVTVTSFIYPSDVVVGVGEYNVELKYTKSSVTEALSVECKFEGTQYGSLRRSSNNSYSYTPPATITTNSRSDVISCQVVGYPNTRRPGTIRIATEKCPEYSISSTRAYIVSGENPMYNRTTLKFVWNEEVNPSYNSLAWWYSNNGAISIDTQSTSKPECNVKPSGIGVSGTYKVVGILKNYGACGEQRKEYGVRVKSVSEVSYKCELRAYPNLNGEKCFIANTQTPDCETTQVKYNEKCYTITSLPGATQVVGTCPSGSVSYQVDENIDGCRSTTGVAKTKTCPTNYTLAPAASPYYCYNKKDKDCNNVTTYTQDCPGGGCETYTVSRICAAKPGGPFEAPCYSKTRYVCTGCLYGEYTYISDLGGSYCRSTPDVNSCPTDKTYYQTTTDCYPTVDKGADSWKCDSGTLVSTNRCITSDSVPVDGSICKEGYFLTTTASNNSVCQYNQSIYATTE